MASMTAEQEHEAYTQRLAERAAEQLARHQADPLRVPKYLPVDDHEFPDDSFTAGWRRAD
jgi:hypothetical protein